MAVYNKSIIKRTMVTFVKWVGGKTQVIKDIEKLWPKKFNTYYEPFVVGGVVLFYFQPEKAIIHITALLYN